MVIIAPPLDERVATAVFEFDELVGPARPDVLLPPLLGLVTCKVYQDSISDEHNGDAEGGSGDDMGMQRGRHLQMRTPQLSGWQLRQ